MNTTRHNSEKPHVQFVSLPEAIYNVISTLNQSGKPASLEEITIFLHKLYPAMNMPQQEILIATLRTLLADGTVYGSNNNYVISRPFGLYGKGKSFGFNRPFTTPSPNIDSAPSVLPSNGGSYYGFGSFPDGAYINDLIIKQNIKRPQSQELCSRECQTGASIVNGPAYQSTSNATETRKMICEMQTQLIPKERPKQLKGLKQQELEKLEQVAKLNIQKVDKQGFFSRFFRRRSKSKDRNADLRIKSPNLEQINQINQQPACCSGKASRPVSFTEKNKFAVQHSTFSAQFPPPEWKDQIKNSHDALKLQNIPMQQHYVPFFRAQHLARINNNNVVTDLDTCANRQNDGHENIKRKYHNNYRSTRVYKNQQMEMLNHRASVKLTKDVVIEGNDRNGLPRFISSSSECLYPMCNPIELSNNTPISERNSTKVNQEMSKRRISRDVHTLGPQRSRQSKYGETKGLVDLSKLPVSEPVPQNNSDFKTQQTKVSIENENERKVFCNFPAPIACSTDLDETEIDKLSDINGLTSSPTPPRDYENRYCSATTSSNSGEMTLKREEQHNNTKIEQIDENCQNACDSAVSVSPNSIIDRIDNRYSSWSGSEGKHADLVDQCSDKKVDHTYINYGEGRIKSSTIPMDRTYENINDESLCENNVEFNHSIQSLDSTQFEHITDATLDENNLSDLLNNKICLNDQNDKKLKYTHQYVSAL